MDFCSEKILKTCRTLGWTLAIMLPLSGCDRYRSDEACSSALEIKARERWVVDQSGLAHDLDNGLIWYRCNAGERYSEGRCVGEAASLTFPQAQLYAADFASASGRPWRLPTRAEVASLRVPSCTNPALDRSIFPSVLIGHYWVDASDHMKGDVACSLYTYNGWVHCRDDPGARRHVWLVVER